MIVTLGRQKSRELVLEILFSLEFHSDQPGLLISLIMKEHKVTKKIAATALEQALAVLQEKSALDNMIRNVSKEFDLQRIHLVERNILRLIFSELFLQKTLPKEIAIAEAKRLARKFSTKEAASFVHGMIDAELKR